MMPSSATPSFTSSGTSSVRTNRSSMSAFRAMTERARSVVSNDRPAVLMRSRVGCWQAALVRYGETNHLSRFLRSRSRTRR